MRPASLYIFHFLWDSKRLVGMGVIKNGVSANKIITFVTKFNVQLVHALFPNVQTIALFIIVSLTYK